MAGSLGDFLASDKGRKAEVRLHSAVRPLIPEPAYWVERAIAALGAGRPENAFCIASMLIWKGRLIVAHIELNRALGAANFWGDRRAKARVMRMANWVRAEKRRVAREAL